MTYWPCLSPALSIVLAVGAQPQSAADFDEGMESVQRLMERGKWARARAALVELVEAHEGAPHVLMQQGSIVDDLKRCVFYERYKAPALDELISGELVSWKESSGQVKLRYTQETLDDFVRAGGSHPRERILLHPLTFEGAYSVEIEFDPYPDDQIPQVIIGFDTEKPVRVVFGHKKTNKASSMTWVPAKILMPDDPNAEYRVVAEESNPPVKAKGRQKVKVTVKSGTVALYANGRKYLTAKRKQGIYGQIGLYQCAGISMERIVIQGEAQPTWFQGLLDEQAGYAWEEFEADFKPLDHLPRWLVSPIKRAAGEPPPEVAYPGEPRVEQDRVFPEFLEELDDEHFNRARNRVLRLDEEKTTATFRYFLESLLLARTGEHEQALHMGQRAHELDPAHQGTRMLLAQLLIALGRTRPAVELLEGLNLDRPTDADVITALVHGLLRLGEMQRARQVVEGALVAGVPAWEIKEVQSFVTKALRGPQWRRRYEHRSKHYEVFSDIDERICFEAGNHLEKSLQRFNRDLRRVPRADDRRYVVYLFSGHEGYQSYIEDIAGTRIENTAGLYSGSIKQLLIWNLPDRERMFSTIRHEGFHQYFDRLVEDPPRWLNEGLAEYYERIELVQGSWKQGLANPTHLRVLDGQKFPSLQDFVVVPDSVFFSEASISYALSWALVHFLRHGGRQNGEIFDTLIDALMDGASQEEAVAKAFADVDYRKLDRAFRAHVDGL